MKLRTIITAFAAGVALADGFVEVAEAENRPSIEALGDDAYATMEVFSRCSARFEFGALVAQVHERPAQSEYLKSVARGSIWVARYFSWVLANTVGEVGGEPFRLEMERLQSVIDQLVEVETQAQFAFVESGQLDETGVKYCMDVQEFQSRVVDEMRRSGLFSGAEITQGLIDDIWLRLNESSGD